MKTEQFAETFRIEVRLEHHEDHTRILYKLCTVQSYSQHTERGE